MITEELESAAEAHQGLGPEVQPLLFLATWWDSSLEKQQAQIGITQRKY